jgi:hypothetical protein
MTQLVKLQREATALLDLCNQFQERIERLVNDNQTNPVIDYENKFNALSRSLERLKKQYVKHIHTIVGML